VLSKEEKKKLLQSQRAPDGRSVLKLLWLSS